MFSPSRPFFPPDRRTITGMAVRRQLTLLEVRAGDLTVVHLLTEHAFRLMRLGDDPNDADPRQAIA